MAKSYPSPGELLLTMWRRLHRLPGGTWLFSWFLGRMVPYTGSLGARVRELRPGYARTTLRDHRGVRNHLNSIHAVALINLGEFTSGLAMLTSLPANVQAIVTAISMEYFKKARGSLQVESGVSLPEVKEEIDHAVRADIHDRSGDVVARASVCWRLRPGL